MPLIMNIEDIDSLDGLAPRACEVCHRKDGISRCSGCLAVYYCGRDCQIEDRPLHKTPCKLLKEALRECKKEEEKLLDETPDGIYSPGNVFEDEVGNFWNIMATRPYMSARFELVHHMLMSYGTPGGPVDVVQMALDHYLDMLRLSRSDNLGVRELIPALYIRLGRDQDAYDFVKWYAAIAENPDYYWGDMNAPFLDTKNADVLEAPLARAWTSVTFMDMSHAVTLLLLKVRVLLDLQSIQNAAIALRGVIPPEIIAIICGKLIRRDVLLRHKTLLSRPEKLAPLLKRIKSQIREVYKTVGKYNPHFWNLMVNDPDACILWPQNPDDQMQRSLGEALVVLGYAFSAWYETPGAVKVLRDLAQMN
ncbi:hypothetical protein ACHAQJ_007537 [Trichoderma viride]